MVKNWTDLLSALQLICCNTLRIRINKPKITKESSVNYVMNLKNNKIKCLLKEKKRRLLLLKDKTQNLGKSSFTNKISQVFKTLRVSIFYNIPIQISQNLNAGNQRSKRKLVRKVFFHQSVSWQIFKEIHQYYTKYKSH